MAKRKPLSPRQELFAKCVGLQGMSASAAYREAYDVGDDTLAKTVHEAASRIRNNSKVSARINFYIDSVARGAVQSQLSDREACLKKLRELIHEATPADSQKVAALRLLGESVGLYKQTIEQKVTRSSDDLLTELDALLSQTIIDESGAIEDAPENPDLSQIH